MQLPEKRSKLCLSLAVFTLVAVVATLNFTSGERKIEHRIPPQFSRTMGLLLGPAIVDGNRFQILPNGDQIFPSMLSAIRSAQRTITFETYIYWSGRIRQGVCRRAGRARSRWSQGAVL
jgi:cardiolipin synthase